MSTAVSIYIYTIHHRVSHDFTSKESLVYTVQYHTGMSFSPLQTFVRTRNSLDARCMENHIKTRGFSQCPQRCPYIFTPYTIGSVTTLQAKKVVYTVQYHTGMSFFPLQTFARTRNSLDARCMEKHIKTSILIGEKKGMLYNILKQV